MAVSRALGSTVDLESPASNLPEAAGVQSRRDPLLSYIHHMYLHSSGRLRFEWDPGKAFRNVHKHGVTFVEASTAFSDEQAVLLDDPDPADGEDRYVLLGLSATLRLLVVVHCYRHEDRTIRLISARKATRTERAQYDARFRR